MSDQSHGITDKTSRHYLYTWSISYIYFEASHPKEAKKHVFKMHAI